MHDARIVGDDVEEVFRLLERADNGVVRAFEDADDAAFGPARSAAAARKSFIARDPRHHPVAMHGGAGILGGDVKVLLARFVLVGQKGEPRLMHVQQTGDEIGFRGEDVAILPDARDFAGALQLVQGFV